MDTSEVSPGYILRPNYDSFNQTMTGKKDFPMPDYGFNKTFMNETNMGRSRTTLNSGLNTSMTSLKV